MFSSTISEIAWAASGPARARASPTTRPIDASARSGAQCDRTTCETGRLDAAEHDIGVGHRGLHAAPVVAGGTGIGPRARRAHGQATHCVHAGDGPPARPDLDHLDGRNADGEAASLQIAVGAGDLEGAGRLRLEVVNETKLGGRPAHVEGERVRACALARDLGGEDGSAGRSRLDQPDGKARRNVERREATPRGHEEERTPEAEFPERRGQAGEIARHPGLDVGVGAGRRLPLVLPDFRTHFAREGDAEVGERSAQDVPDPPLVGGVRVGMQQSDRD